MQRKIVISLIIIMTLLNSNFYGLVDVIPENKIGSRITGQGLGCSVVEAADTEDEKNETIENMVTDETEEEKVLEESEWKYDDFGNTIIDNSKQKELTENELLGKAGVSEDIQIDKTILLEEEDKKAQEMIEEKQEKDCIYNVSFPVTSKVYLDPGNLSGKGQIFSEEYKVENYGNTDIAIKIKNINVFYYSTQEVYELSEQIKDADPYVKKVNVDIVWRNEKENTETVLDVVEGAPDEYVLALEASEYDENEQFIRLNEGSTGLFYFTGSVNPDPELVWEDSEVTISFDYEVENIDKDEEAENSNEKERMELQDMEKEQEQEELKIPYSPEETMSSEAQKEPEVQKSPEEVNDLESDTGSNEQGDPKVQTENREHENLDVQVPQEESLQPEDEQLPIPQTLDGNEKDES